MWAAYQAGIEMNMEMSTFRGLLCHLKESLLVDFLYTWYQP